jgi:hypothetical protein
LTKLREVAKIREELAIMYSAKMQCAGTKETGGVRLSVPAW